MNYLGGRSSIVLEVRLASILTSIPSTLEFLLHLKLIFKDNFKILSEKGHFRLEKLPMKKLPLKRGIFAGPDNAGRSQIAIIFLEAFANKDLVNKDPNEFLGKTFWGRKI